jgi:hypothetical protein
MNNPTFIIKNNLYILSKQKRLLNTFSYNINAKQNYITYKFINKEITTINDKINEYKFEMIYIPHTSRDYLKKDVNLFY